MTARSTSPTGADPGGSGSGVGNACRQMDVPANSADSVNMSLDS